MKTMRMFLVLIFATFFFLGFAATSFALITGTPHDLSGDFTGSTDEICIFCHTPHNAKAIPTDYNPLWNMDTPLSAGYIPYASSTFMDGGTTISDPLVGPSRLCMSCHDGTIAIDNAVNATSTDYIQIFNPSTTALLGTDLSNDHPIGFDYVAAQALDLELYPASTAYAGGLISDFLFGDVMTCASCHDVHEENGVGGMFLLVDNNASALCLSCHIK